MPQTPIKLYSKSLGEWVEVPYHQLDSSLKSGEYLPPTDQDFPVVDTAGAARYARNENIFKAFQEGGGIPQSMEGYYRAMDQANQRNIGSVATGALHFAESSGLHVPSLIGGEAAKGLLKTTAEEHPIPALIGDVAGYIPKITPAGALTVAAGKVAAKAATIKGSEAVVGSFLAKKAIPMAAAGAAENLVFGRVESLNEASLGDPQSVAEALFAGGGADVVLGGVAGAAGAIIGRGYEGYRAYKQTKNIANEAAKKASITNSILNAAAVKSGKGRAAFEQEAAKTVRVAYEMPHPVDGNPLIMKLAKPKQNQERIKEATELWGKAIGETRKKVSTIVDELPEAQVVMGEYQKAIVPRLQELEAGLAVEDKTARLYLKKAIAGIEKPRSNFKSFIDTMDYHGNQAKWPAGGQPLTGKEKIAQRVNRVMSDEFDRAVELHLKPEGLAEFKKFKDGYHIGKMMEKGFAVAEDISSPAWLKRALPMGGKSLIGGFAADMIAGDGFDPKAFAVGALLGQHIDRIPSVLAYGKYKLQGFSKVTSSLAATTERMTKAIGEFIQARPYQARPIKSLTTARILVGERETSPDRHQDTVHAIRSLQKMVNNPDLAANHIASRLEDVEEIAPNLASEMSRKAVAIAGHLLETAPIPTQGNAFQPNLEFDWKPSSYETVKWNWRAEAAFDPLGVVEQMANGKLTSEAVLTLEALYPILYKQMGDKLLGEVASSTKPLTRQQIHQLSVFFKVDVEKAGFIKNNQLVWGQDKSAGQRNKSRATGTTNLARDMMTEAQGRTAEQ